MYIPLLKSHSGLRWIVVILFILAIAGLIRAAYQGKSSNRALLFAKLTLIVSHIQLLLGLWLYFISPKVVFMAESMKNKVLRFYLVEHIALMVIALAVLTIGYVKYKKTIENQSSAKSMLWYYIISFVLIMISIPWPFRGMGAGWF